METRGRKTGWRLDAEKSNIPMSVLLTETQKQEIKDYCKFHNTSVTKLIKELLVKQKIITPRININTQTNITNKNVPQSANLYLLNDGQPYQKENREPRREYFIDVYPYKKKNTKVTKSCHKLEKNKNGHVYITPYVRCNISSNIYQILKSNSDSDKITEAWNDIAVPQHGKIDSNEW